MALQPPVGRAIRTSVASIGAALDHAVDAVTMTHSPVQSISGASGVPSRQRVRPTMDIPGTSMSSMTHNEHHPLRTLSSDMESLGSSREHTMEWKLPSEEQVYEKLPWTRGALFNTVVSTAIFLNTVWLGIETDLHHPEVYENQSLDPWTVVNYCFVFFFCVELLIRIYSRTWWPFITDNWNKFDFLLVVLSVLDTFVLVYISDGSGSLSALRVLRVLRVARVLRLLRFFRPLWLLVIGAVDAMRALLWAWVLISILIYIFAILLTRTVGSPTKKRMRKSIDTSATSSAAPSLSSK